jgi:hypothetical protein
MGPSVLTVLALVGCVVIFPAALYRAWTAEPLTSTTTTDLSRSVTDVKESVPCPVPRPTDARNDRRSR